MLHGVLEHRPSACTRHAHKIQLFSQPSLIPTTHVWEGSRHQLIEALSRALSSPKHPRVMQLTDAAVHAGAVLRAWEQHLGSREGATFAATTLCTEGARRTLQHAWTGVGLSIQHDLDEVAQADNPVVDFLLEHPHLKFSSLWLRIVTWLEAHAGPVMRYPAFIHGANVAPTTTHYDDYDSVAFVLVGGKTFYVAPPNLVCQTGRGRPNESSAHPFQPGSPWEQVLPQPFLKVEVPAGSLLYLPRGWWHFVVSQPNTIMLCAWY